MDEIYLQFIQTTLKDYQFVNIFSIKKNQVKQKKNQKLKLCNTRNKRNTQETLMGAKNDKKKNILVVKNEFELVRTSTSFSCIVSRQTCAFAIVCVFGDWISILELAYLDVEVDVTTPELWSFSTPTYMIANWEEC